MKINLKHSQNLNWESGSLNKKSACDNLSQEYQNTFSETVIEPGGKITFHVINCFKFKITIENKIDSPISASLFIDEGVPVVVIGPKKLFLGLNNGEQTVTIDHAFCQKYKLLG